MVLNRPQHLSGSMSQLDHSRPNWVACLMSGLPPIATELRTSLEVRFVPTCDIERAGRPKEKAARRRLSILIIVDHAAINAGSDFGRWAVLADNDF
jgi:hypothetical protein